MEKGVIESQKKTLLLRREREVTVYIYIIYTPNLGLKIAILVREREQGRFRGSIEGAGGAAREH